MRTKNYVVWRQRLELNLRTNRLSSYIMQELGNENISTDEKYQIDAAVFRHLRTTTSHDIANGLLRFKTTYQAFKHLEVYYGGKRLQYLLRLEQRAKNLHFADHFIPLQLSNEFDKFIDEYIEN